jgi:hypothetical protein
LQSGRRSPSPRLAYVMNRLCSRVRSVWLKRSSRSVGPYLRARGGPHPRLAADRRLGVPVVHSEEATRHRGYHIFGTTRSSLQTKRSLIRNFLLCFYTEILHAYFSSCHAVRSFSFPSKLTLLPRRRESHFQLRCSRKNCRRSRTRWTTNFHSIILRLRKVCSLDTL